MIEGRSALLDAALSYAKRGWPVFPVHTVAGGCSCGHAGCQSPGKHPRIKRWQREATVDEAQVRKWWKAWPDANIGLATGRRAGFWVLDVDTDKGGAESLAALEGEHGKLPDTVESLTGGGGRHLLFAWPDGLIVRNTSRLAGMAGLDLRGEGGYIVAPPSGHASGWEYAWEASSDPGDGVAIAEAPEWLLDIIQRGNLRIVTPQPQASEPGGSILEGGRNNALARLAGAMRRYGAEPDEILAALETANAKRCRPPLEHDELVKIARSVGRYAPAVELEASVEPVPPAETPEAPEEPPADAHLTDWGNAQRLVAMHGDDMRYCEAWGCWLIWDGQRWARDDNGAAVRLAKDVVATLYEEAGKTEDEQRRKALAKHALKSEAQHAITAMLQSAKSELPMPVRPEELDANAWLLNCANGTLDLRTGKLRAHRREDLITKLAPVDYDPSAALELWQRFLDDATGGDRDLQAFLQRAAGYSLTGETDEEKLFFVHGPGAAGKSTFLEALKGAMGSYAQTADFETFIARSMSGSVRPDVAKMAGARLVVSIEVDEGKKLAEGLVKTLTGGDTVSARFLYRDYFEYKPAFKLWLAANHAPEVKDNDEAMWRRILRLPFEHEVPEEKRDPAVKATLRDPAAAGPAVLAWAVQGCLAWQEQGLGIPGVVKTATAAYRLENDPLRDFLEVRCLFGAVKTARIAEMSAAYKKWCDENGLRQMNSREFNQRLEARGCRRVHTRTGSLWVGIGLVIPGCDGSDGSDDDSSNLELVSASQRELLKTPSQSSQSSQVAMQGMSEADKDPTDTGQWTPPPAIKHIMEEVFGNEEGR